MHLTRIDRFGAYHKEIKALELYKEYLEFLIANHFPEDTIAMYNYFADKAGFVEGNELYTQNIALELDRNRRMIRESYKDAQRLITIVDEVIKKAKKDKTRVGYF